MSTLLREFNVGDMVPTTVSFRCLARGHAELDEVRLTSITEVSDRRFKEGVRQVRVWAGYCSRCGRRVVAEPFAS